MNQTALTSRPVRNYYLDWLRVMAMLTVFLYHNNRFFNHEDWQVKNPQLSSISDVINGSISMWMMPLLFVLSGAAIFLSLRNRDKKAFIRERFLRLMVPLLTLGLFVFGPLQIYLERYSHGDFTGSIWQFLPHYFEGFYGFGGNFAWMGVHLWYLLLLFVLSLLLLPVFASGKNGAGALARLSAGLAKPWFFWGLFLPAVLAPLLADVLGLGITRGFGGWDILFYALMMLYGYIIFANPDAAAILRRNIWPIAVVAVILFASNLILNYVAFPDGFFGDRQLRAAACWSFILLVLAAVRLNFCNRFLKYANEAVLPFYILHQPVILSVGFFVVQSNLPVPVKYLVTTGISFVAIMLIYEFLVRRWAPVRFLFGLKPQKTAV